jgi:plasmid rolling circle replication initiator protein Rep
MSILTKQMPNLTENAKVLILSKLEDGWSIRRVAHYYNIDKSTVQRYTIMEKRIEEFVKIAIAVKCNQGDNTDNQR